MKNLSIFNYYRMLINRVKLASNFVTVCQFIGIKISIDWPYFTHSFKCAFIQFSSI